jgi:NAD(P)H dehydrogenase (quinone)
MSSTVSNILVILASPMDQNDQRLNQVNKYCRSFAQICTENGINVDILDLYNEEDNGNLIGYLAKDNSKVLEYQIRITKADQLIFFHPVTFDSVPAILKGFLENVFCAGFAYKIERQITVGMLNKKATVFAFDDQSKWSSKVIQGDQLSNFWNKSIFNLTGLKGDLDTFFNFRSSKANELEKIKLKIDKIAARITSKSNLLDM